MLPVAPLDPAVTRGLKPVPLPGTRPAARGAKLVEPGRADSCHTRGSPRRRKGRAFAAALPQEWQ